MFGAALLITVPCVSQLIVGLAWCFIVNMCCSECSSPLAVGLCFIVNICCSECSSPLLVGLCFIVNICCSECSSPLLVVLAGSVVVDGGVECFSLLMVVLSVFHC